MSTLYESTLRSLPLLGRGKVRDNYAVGNDQLLIVTTDRLSAFDVIMGEPIPNKGRVLNVHPALLPKYGGQGMYGHHVHEAVLAAGETESGCTIHITDEEYDHGPIILQRTVPVLPGDTPDTLAERVQAAEREAYPEAVRILQERLHY